jgi:hypothetical protein
MTEHVTKQKLEMFRTGGLTGEELIRIDDHLVSCAACRSMLAESDISADASTRFSRVLLTPDHLTYAQLEGYLDGRLPSEERAAVDLHVQSCLECGDDLRDLGASSTAEQIFAPARGGERPSLLGWLFARPVPVFATVIAIVSILGLVWLLSSRSTAPNTDEVVEVPPVNSISRPSPVVETPPPPPESSEPELAVSINDGGETVGISKDGELVGYSSVSTSYRGAIKNALTSGRLGVPDLDDLKGTSGALMGNNEGPSFRVNGPVGKVVIDSSPAFSWQAVPGAEGYVVEVFDKDFKKVAESSRLKTTNWKGAALARGRTYVWQVTATRAGETLKAPQRPAPEARFRIVDTKTANELAALRRSNPRSHLLLGVAFANSGLIDDARRELQLAARENPRLDLPKKLLRQLPR